MFIFPGLFLISIGFGGWAATVRPYRPWGAAAFLAGVLFGLGHWHVRKRHVAAWKIAKNPQLVYWAHAVDRHGYFSEEESRECPRLLLHTRDGSELEGDLPRPEMRAFTAWLTASNPAVRWGAYDSFR
jgi:hypothetical protein